MTLESTRSPDDPRELSATGLRPAQIRASHLEKRAIIYARQSSMLQVREHTGSTAVQRELVNLPRQWGWPESRIEVIDDDLGLSGTSVQNRTGLHRLHDLMDRGEVGLIVVRDVSRISRNPHDAEIFLTKLIDQGVLLYAGGQLFDGATQDLAQLFGLRVQNLLAWWENQNRAHTMRSAKAAKVRQGHAVTPPPVGYVKSTVRGKWIKDPEVGVQETIRRIFDLYLETGSTGNVVRYMRRHNLPFPRRRGAEVKWRLPSRSQTAAILTNPTYTGLYVFHRTTSATSARAASGRRQVLRPPADWITVPNHHEPYVTQAEWQVIQTALASRRPRVQPPVGRGFALLQGLLRCPQCNRWLATRYQMRKGAIVGASYACVHQDRLDIAHCHLSSGTKLLDGYIVRRVLDALQPVQVRAALEAIKDHGTEQAAIAKAQRRHVQQVEDDVEAARQRYALADPNHRLVKADLEAQLEHALAKRDALKWEMAAANPAPPIALRAEDARDVIALSERVEALWDAPTTTIEDRKRLLRLVISCVLVHAVTDEAVELEIIWASGLQERCRVLRSAGVSARAHALALTGKTSGEIAAELRADGVISTYGRPLSKSGVITKLHKLGVTPKATRHEALVKIRALLMDGRRHREILDTLNRDLPPHSKRWTSCRLSSTVTKLRRGAVPDVPPLPRLLPEDHERDAILELVVQRRETGYTFAAIARELNASGLRPRFAARFSKFQVADLLRSRRAQLMSNKNEGSST